MEVDLGEATSGSITRVDKKVVILLLLIYIVEVIGMETRQLVSTGRL